jgi:hypothetical protein
MSESGATAWEIRELARYYDTNERAPNPPEMDWEYRDAILCEALNCLADKKEAERNAA